MTRWRATPVFTTILRHVLTRLLAALIVILVLSPYSEPFATIHGTDFGGSGAVDVDGGAAKPKPSTKEALVAPPIVAVVVVDLRATAGAAIVPSATLDSHSSQRTILRL